MTTPTSDIPAFPTTAPASDIPPFPGDEPAAPPPAKPFVGPPNPPPQVGTMPWVREQAQYAGKNLLSVADMIGSIPAGVVGTAADIGFRARGAALGESHKQASQEGNVAFQVAMEKYGSPFSKLLSLAGLGKEEGGPPGAVDSLMTKATNLLGKGGEWVEEKTGGAVNKEDVQSLTNWLMSLGGAKGLKAGVEKMAKAMPDAVAKGVARTPEAEAREQQLAAQQSDDPQAPAKMADAHVEAAAAAKTRLLEGKPLVLDPRTGELSEAVSEPGKPLPKPTSRETALEKVAGGRAFDMTAEERIAYQGFQKEPLPQPLVDESGKILDQKRFDEVRRLSGGPVSNQRGATILPFRGPKTLEETERLYEQTFQRYADGGYKDKELQQQAWDLGMQAAELRAKATAAEPAKGLGEVFPGFTVIPKGTEIYATHGLKYTEPVKVRVIGSKPVKVGDKLYNLPVAEFPDGSTRTVMKGDVQEVYRPRSLPGQSGSVDPAVAARLAAIGLGAWAGAYFSDKDQVQGAILGGAAALGATLLPAKAAVKNLTMLAKADDRIRINDLADAHEKYTTLAAHDVWALQQQIEDLVPKEADRAAITHAMEAGPAEVAKLSPLQQKAAQIARDYFDGVGQVASLEGILKSAREDYVTHIWDWSGNKGLFQKWMDSRAGAQGMGTHNRYAEERSIPTIAEGKKQGLTPVTEDISRIMGIYGNSMSRSIANSVFTRALRNETIPGTNQHVVLPADQAPHSYVSINNPNLVGLRVHPDIAPSLKMLYETSSPGAAMKTLMGISDTLKRISVSVSLFHAKALTDAMIGGSKNPVAALMRLPGIIRGTDQFLQELRKGSASIWVQRAAEGGLKYSLEGAGTEDAGAGFYGAMTSLQKTLDAAIPGAGLPIKGFEALNHGVDTLMWARLHAGMKLNMFAEKYQQLMDNSAAAAAKGKGVALTEEQAARIAASYTNDLFGGLNWRRVAEDATTRFGRELGQATLNPGSRRVLQLLAFAPDWTVSTTRAAVQAFGKPDFINPKTLAGLHQQYLIRSAMYYLVVGDAINYSMSGHHLWQNKDPTVLDMDPKGDRHMQWSKHTMEPAHWLTKPGQQAINKLGILPREAIEQGLDVEYLSAKGRMPPMKSRLGHLAKNVAPIAVQQGSEGSGASVVSGFAGVPIYGKTAEEKRAAKEEARRERNRQHKRKPQ